MVQASCEVAVDLVSVEYNCRGRASGSSGGASGSMQA
jgi:hypothetical protein